MLAKKFAIGVGIALVFPIMIHYAVSTFVPQPKEEPFYQYQDYQQRYEEASPEQKTAMREEKNQRETKKEAAQKCFQKWLFIVALPLGIAGVIIGSNIAIQSVGAGLMFGGVFAVTDGYCYYWSELADWLKFFSLAISLAILIFIGYRKFANNK